MMDTMSDIKTSTICDKLKAISFVAISTFVGGAAGYYLQGSITEGALISASLSITVICLILFNKPVSQANPLQSNSHQNDITTHMQLTTA